MENPTNKPQMALARQEELVVQEMPDEVLIYDLKQHKAHCLNKTAALVWNHCDGETSVSEMTALLQQEAGSPVDEEVVWYTLDKLGKANLLEKPLAPPSDTAMTRRRMVKRVGSLLVLPAVISLVAPKALAVGSFVTTSHKIACGQCNQQDNPRECTMDTCCTGQCNGPQKTCVEVGPSPTPGLVDTLCAVNLCQPATAANPCSGQGQPPNPN